MAAEGRKPRVAWIASSPTPYHVSLFEFLHQTARLDLHVFFCSDEHASQPWLVECSKALNVTVSRGMRIPLPTRRRSPRYFNPGILKALVRQTWDVVVIAGYAHPTMQAAILCCLARRIPFMLHGDTHLLRRRHWAKRAAKRLLLFPLLRRCSAGLGLGVLAREYWQSVGIPRDRTFIVPLVSHLEAFRETSPGNRDDRRKTRQHLGVPEEALLGIYAGRLIQRKGVDLLLHGLAMIDPARRPHLVIVGDGPQRASLEGLAGEGSLPVAFTGFRQNHELPALYAASDFFVLPSREEPWGIVVAEAMAAGLPVVLSDQVGAAYDLLEDGRNGFLVRCNSAEAWREALERCVDEKGNLEAMGGESRRIISRWTREASADQFLKAVELSLASRRRQPCALAER